MSSTAADTASPDLHPPAPLPYRQTRPASHAPTPQTEACPTGHSPTHSHHHDPVIQAAGVVKRFGATTALAGVDLVAEAGTVLGLLGPNGSGKTTMVRILSTLLTPDEGWARAAGCDVVADAARLRSRIGLAGQYAAVDELLTGRENLELVARWYHLPRPDCRKRAREILQRFNLAAAADRQVKTYSGGMRRRLDIGASLIARPPVLFLDEPTTGLDPRTRNDLWQFIEELVAAGTTVLLTTQYMEEAERLADRIVVLDRGRTIALGTAEELKAQLGGDTLEARVSRQEDIDRATGAGQPRAGPTAHRRRPPARQRTNPGRYRPAPCSRTAIRGAGHTARRPGHPTPLPRRRVPLAHRQRPSHDRPRATGDDQPGKSSDHMTSISLTPPESAPAEMTPFWALSDTAGVAKRNLLRILRTPRLLLIGTLQPALLLLLFRYVLGGAIKVPGSNYVDYVVPAIFVEAVLIGGMTTSIGLAQDLQTGIIDRFRSLPMARSAVLAGRTLADLARNALSLTIMIGLGLAVGFRFHNSAMAILAGMIVILGFGYSFSWVYATIGLATKDPETAQIAGILPFFILMFASNAIVPLATMPGWLQPFARNQPLSVAVSSVRSLLNGGPAAHWAWQTLVWSLAIFAVFFALSLRLYRRSTS